MSDYSVFHDEIIPSQSDEYIRAVYNHFFDRNGCIVSATFKSSRGGVSVTRSNESVAHNAMCYMKQNYQGKMAVFPVASCGRLSIHDEYEPSPYNSNHWGLYGDTEHNDLSNRQIAGLIDSVTRVE